MSKELYKDGTVLTLCGPQAQAVLVEDGVVRAVGDSRQLEALCGADTVRVSLEGGVLMPSFIDAHSHITSLASSLSSAKLEGAQSFEELARRLETFLEQTPPAPGQWVSGFGYDQNVLQEHTHPTKALLDAVCPARPMIIAHASGHMGVMNSAALRESGITADTPDPAGGLIGRLSGSREPSGYLEETAFTGAGAHIPAPTREQERALLERAQQIYLRHGITTIQDGFTGVRAFGLLEEMAREKRLKADVVCYLDLQSCRELLRENSAYRAGYCDHLKIGGYKIFLDGSPQGRTAWMSAPYLNAEDGYRGYPVHEDAAVEAFMETALADSVQILAHCNGDAAAQQLLNAYARAREKNPDAPDIRPVMIHAQLLRRDQLPLLAKLRIIASFFVAHTYYWGDAHRTNLGPERADFISPVASAIRQGVCYTFHQDTPVVQPDMLFTLQCAVRRTTRGGVLLGESERVTPQQALAGVTVNAAYQYFEESRKGTIAPGKRADFVLLDKNPLTVPTQELGAVQILKTVKDGEILFSLD